MDYSNLCLMLKENRYRVPETEYHYPLMELGSYWVRISYDINTKTPMEEATAQGLSRKLMMALSIWFKPIKMSQPKIKHHLN